MDLYLYTYKGPPSSLLGLWIVGSYIIKNPINESLYKIPSKDSLFKKRDSLKHLDSLYRNNINIISILSKEINDVGNLVIANSYNTLIGRAFEFLEDGDTLSIHYVDINNKPSFIERALILYTVFIRNSYLTRLSNIYEDYNYLDSNIDIHIKFLSELKYLPPKYLTEKCLKAFRHINPKPYWYRKEIDYLYNLKRNIT